MNRVKNFCKKYWIYLIAFMLPCAIAFGYYVVKTAWKNESISFLYGDTAMQLVPFAYELWEKVHLGDSLLYTWNVAGGCDFQAIIGVLVSPFTLLMLLFPKSSIPGVIQFSMIMKWALTAVTMVYFFYHTKHNTLQCHKKVVSLFLGLAYALGNGIVSYIAYIQFMDVMICFPLLLLLVERLVDEGKWKCYCMLLAFCIMSNSYISFEICIFLVLWFVLQLNSSTENIARKFLVFAGSSILSALSAVFLVLPVFTIAQGRIETGAYLREVYARAILISIPDFIKQLFIFTDISGPSKTAPNIYFSLLAVFLVLFFPVIKIGKRRKWYMLLVAVMLVTSFFFGKLSLVWHLFNSPNGVYHRFMYIFTFFMLFMLLYVLLHLQDIKKYQVLVLLFVVAGGYIYTFFHLEQYASYIVYLVTALLTVLYSMILFLYCKNSISYKNILCVIAVFGILESVVNAGYTFGAYNLLDYYGEGGVMRGCMDLLESAELGPKERVTFDNAMSNMGLVASKNADAAFISAINTDNKIFHEKLGMSSRGNVQYSDRGASPLLNLMFNIRYGIGESAMMYSDAELVDQYGEMQMYRMNRLAGLGYMVDDTVKDWTLEGDGFQAQNEFIEKAVGGKKIFQPVTPDIRCVDVSGNQIEENKDYSEYDGYVYSMETQFGNEYDVVDCSFTVDEDMDLYVYFSCSVIYTVSIYIDDELQHVDRESVERATYHIGDVKKGQRIELVAVPRDNSPPGNMVNLIFIFNQFDEEAYAEAYEKLSKNVYNIETEKSDYIKGSIQADKDGIMMTSIQAVDGFTVYVDGQETEYEIIGGAMIGVPLKSGRHTVEFKYHAKYLLPGFCISGGAVLIFLTLCLADRKKKKRIKEPVQEAEA